MYIRTLRVLAEYFALYANLQPSMGATFSFDERYKILQEEFPNDKITKKDNCTCAYYCYGRSCEHYYCVSMLIDAYVLTYKFPRYLSHCKFIEKIKFLKYEYGFYNMLFLNGFKYNSDTNWYNHSILGYVKLTLDYVYYKDIFFYTDDEFLEELKNDLGLFNKIATS